MCVIHATIQTWSKNYMSLAVDCCTYCFRYKVPWGTAGGGGTSPLYECKCDTELCFLPLTFFTFEVAACRGRKAHTHTPETCLPCQSCTVSHWAVLLEVQCLAQGHFSSSCCCNCYCGTEMCFSFSSLTEISFVLFSDLSRDCNLWSRGHKLWTFRL